MWALFKEVAKRVEVLNGIRTALCAFLSFYLCLWLNEWLARPDSLNSVLWGVVASAVVLQSNLGSTYQAVWNRLLGVFIGSLIGAAAAYFFGSHVLVLSGAMFAAIAICSALNLHESYRMACLSVAVVIIPWGLHPTLSPWSFAFFRFINTCIGVLVAVFVARHVWPTQALEHLRQNLVSALEALSQYYVLLSHSSDPSFKQGQSVQELTLEVSQQISNAYKSLEESKVERSLSPVTTEVWTDMINCVEALLEALNALSHVFSQQLESVFDEELKQQIKKIMGEMTSIFTQTIVRFQTAEKMNMTILTHAQEELNAQMARFRETRITRQYNLQMVEDYFVFFYHLKAIMGTFIHLHRLMDLLSNDASTSRHS